MPHAYMTFGLACSPLSVAGWRLKPPGVRRTPPPRHTTLRAARCLRASVQRQPVRRLAPPLRSCRAEARARVEPLRRGVLGMHDELQRPRLRMLARYQLDQPRNGRSSIAAPLEARVDEE